MDLLEKFTRIIKKECDNAIRYKLYGTDEFHIESIERVEDDEHGAMMFLVTTWNDPSVDSRQTRKYNLFELMDLLGRIISHRGVSDAVMAIEE